MDAESAPAVAKETEQNASAEKPTTPAKDSKEKEGRKGILNAIRIPLVSSVFPRRKKVSVTCAEKYFISKFPETQNVEMVWNE